MRLASALLGYFAFVTLVITLSPFEFVWRDPYVASEVRVIDSVLNVALFIPIGFLLQSLGQPPARFGWRIGAAFALSAAIEFVQVFIPGRFPSPADVAANTAGAWLGVVLRDRIERASFWHRDSVGRVGLDVPVVGLLYLLVPQLWLSCAGMVEDRRRLATTGLLLCTGASVLIDVRRARSRSGERRFEIETLRRVVPLFGTYLVIAALWPPFRDIVPWHGEFGITGRVKDGSALGVLLLLEQVGGFTLLGYAVAEWRSRRELTLTEDLPLVTVVAAGLALSLEVVQGFLAGSGASLFAPWLSIGGAMYGAAVYHAARTHVRALRRPHSP